METRVAGLSDLDDLLPLVAAFRDELKRTRPDDSSIRENLRCLISGDDAEFFLMTDDSGGRVGYIQQRYRFYLWLGDPEATLEDLFVARSSRRQGLATHLVRFAVERATEQW